MQKHSSHVREHSTTGASIRAKSMITFVFQVHPSTESAAPSGIWNAEKLLTHSFGTDMLSCEPQLFGNAQARAPRAVGRNARLKQTCKMERLEALIFWHISGFLEPPSSPQHLAEMSKKFRRCPGMLPPNDAESNGTGNGD